MVSNIFQTKFVSGDTAVIDVSSVFSSSIPGFISLRVSRTIYNLTIVISIITDSSYIILSTIKTAHTAYLNRK